jgi:hypothetical protein
MRMDDMTHRQAPVDEVEIARSGDDAQFTALVETYRHELRMSASDETRPKVEWSWESVWHEFQFLVGGRAASLAVG